jgi:type VI secretion system secreted protein VgrG
MDQAYTQDGRIAAIETPLGKDVLLLTSLSGTEALSEPFVFDVEVVSEEMDLNPEEMVGMEATIRLRPGQGEERVIDGVIGAFSAGDLLLRGWRAYHLHIVPWLWLLSHSADCRIFQDKSVPDIIKQVFHDHGFEDFRFRLHGNYEPLEYCVQYRETTFAFVSRLMEQEGLFYFFEREDDQQYLFICDTPVSFAALPEPDIDCVTAAKGMPGTIWQFRRAFAMRTGKRTFRDFNFERPAMELEEDAKTVLKVKPSQKAEIYDYPGLYADPERGTRLARLEMQAEETSFQRVTGASDIGQLRPGRHFTVAAHTIEPEQGKTYVLRRVEHRATSGSFFGGDAVSEYVNRLEAFPKQTPFRPGRRTPRPFVHGPQTAIVVGPPGEEIHTDKYGRIKLQFHWDREGKKDDKSSCWVRVSQSWAGAGYGFIQIPRIGQEVIVDFIEGDPDRPIVTGRVYNAEQMPPHGLPGGKVKSGLKSNSTKGGGGSNELTFDDTKGSEQVYFHAEKNLDSVVENNETRAVGNNRTTSIGHDETQTVGHDESQTVGNNQTITIGANRTETVAQNEVVTIGMTRTVAIGMVDSLTVGGARAHNVGAAEEIAIGASRSVNVGRDQSVSVGKNQTVSVGENLSTTVGKDETHNVGKKLTITAGDQIVLKTGSATITMKKNGDIIIQGKQISIKGSGDVVLKGKKILEN